MAGADMGLGAGFAAGGAADALKSLFTQRLQQQQLAQQAAQQAAENDYRNRSLLQQEQIRQDALKETARNHDLEDEARKDTNAEKQIGQARTLADQIPAGAALAPTDPAIGMLRTGGLGGLLQHQDPTLPSTALASSSTLPGTAKPQASGILRTQNAGNPEQYLKLASASQANTLADNARADAQAKEMNRHDLAMEAKQPPPQTILVQTVDANGNAVTKIVPKTAGAEFAKPAGPQAEQMQAAKKEALGSLDQVDQALDSAKDLIGPGAGRISSVQQMIGSADPKIQALGTKLLLTKMQVDHAAAGSVRAGASPQILQRWDNLLGNQVSYEGMKAAIQAMREIVASTGGSGASSSPKVIRYDINGNPIK